MVGRERAEELVANARSRSVTRKRLTKLKGGLTARYLYDEPLIEYLREGEQPHFVLAARQKAPRFFGSPSPAWGGETLRGMAMHVLTDERWLIVVGRHSGDRSFEIPIGDVRIRDYSTGHRGHEITVETGTHRIDVPIGNMYDGDEIDAAVDYVRSHETAERGSETSVAERGGEVDVPPAPADESGPSRDSYLPEGAILMAEGKNGQVTLFENKIRISRENIGLLYKMNQLGKGEKEIRLENITSVQLKRPSSLTKGYIQFGQSGYSESDDGAFDAAADENSVLFTDENVDAFVELREEIEQRKDRGNQSGSSQDVADPTEQLKNVKELHDDGILTDEEFEEKRQKLVEKI